MRRKECKLTSARPANLFGWPLAAVASRFPFVTFIVRQFGTPSPPQVYFRTSDNGPNSIRANHRKDGRKATGYPLSSESGHGRRAAGMQTLSARHKLVQSFSSGTSRLYRGCFIRTARSSASVSVPNILQYIITGSARLLTSTLIRTEGANKLVLTWEVTIAQNKPMRETKLSRESDPLSRLRIGRFGDLCNEKDAEDGGGCARAGNPGGEPGKYSLHGTGAGPTPLFKSYYPYVKGVGWWMTVVPSCPRAERRHDTMNGKQLLCYC